MISMTNLTFGDNDIMFVYKPNDQNEDDCREYGEYAVEIAEQIRTHDSRQDTEHHRETTQNGYGNALELACVGIIDDILYFGYFQDIGIYPASTEQGDQSGHKDLQQFVHCRYFLFQAVHPNSIGVGIDPGLGGQVVIPVVGFDSLRIFGDQPFEVGFGYTYTRHLHMY